MKKLAYLPFLLLFVITVFFFRPVFLEGKLPIPADTIIGLYHPFRDLYAPQYPNGIPYKNALITDPVRQQYPWKELAIAVEKSGALPLWNPYTFSGTPLLGTMQSGALYPLNGLFFLVPFAYGWSAFIVLQPLLGGLFLYLYARNLKLHHVASLLGAITFSFSGFSIAWMEWGNILHTALWLPVILLSIDKLFSSVTKKAKHERANVLWSLVLVLSLTASFFAGHLQIFFYVAATSFVYFLARFWQFGKSPRVLLSAVLLLACFLLLTILQWYPTLQFILQSAREIDQLEWQKIEGWFIPYQHLIQFVAPDFFGNPTTLNYWGTWNYGELVGYVGITPLMLALLAIFSRRDKETYFFSLLLIVSLVFALPTILAQVPYQLHIPLLSTSQPTRLLFLVDFALAMLAALGCDWIMRHQRKKAMIIPAIILSLIFGGLWGFAIGGYSLLHVAPEHVATAKRNLLLPTAFLVVSMVLLFALLIKRIPYKGTMVIFCLLLCLTVFDLARFGEKFTPFTDQDYLFPKTKIIAQLQKDTEQFRIMTTDSRLLPPNFSTVYRLQSIDGYDPLYMRRYAEFIAASERGKPDIRPPFGFNRIITPHNYDSRLIDLLGVKYVLSLSEITSPKLEKVTSEGQTIVYRNKEALPRAFFVESIKKANDKQSAMNLLFDTSIDVQQIAIVEKTDDKFPKSTSYSRGTVRIGSYQPNMIELQTDTPKDGYLVLMDSFYPTWHAQVCSLQKTDCRDASIYRTNYQFRGIVVPAGKHHIIFRNSLL